MSDNVLFDHKGERLDFAKAKPPKTGNQFAQWAGRDLVPFELPGGGFLQFDLSRLTLKDYRQMRDHYQINSSLTLLSFMQHQSKWKINHPDKKVRDLLTENLQQIWTQLSRSMSQANWAGYSPSALEWDNYSYDGTTRITKVKDLYPEECRVNWKLEDLYAPPGTIPLKDRVYNGIKKWGQTFPIPVENSFWYPLLMENGNYHGRQILKSVYTSYFFSMLIHLYANRYYERFGEPTPIGRAPFDDDITVQGEQMSGSELMLGMMKNLRSRGVVLLPSDKVEDARGSHYEYDIDYLESQMRGADFERLMQRYDQEMSLGTFTPLLLQQTADIGSYNLGGLHYQMYLMTQNAMNADKANYINWYILMPMIRYNFSASTVPATIEFEQQDNQRSDLIKLIIQGMLAQGTLGFDLNEIGAEVGLTLNEIKVLTAPTGSPDEPSNVDPNANPDGNGKGNDPQGSGAGDKKAVPAGQTGNPSKNRAELRNDILTRVRGQVQNSMSAGKFGPAVEIVIPFMKKVNEEYGKHHAAYIEREITLWTKKAIANPWLSADSFVTGYADVYDHVTTT